MSREGYLNPAGHLHCQPGRGVGSNGRYELNVRFVEIGASETSLSEACGLSVDEREFRSLSNDLPPYFDLICEE